RELQVGRNRAAHAAGDLTETGLDLRNIGFVRSEELAQFSIALLLLVRRAGSLEIRIEDAGVGEDLFPALLRGENEPCAEQGLVELGVPLDEAECVRGQLIAGKRFTIGELRGSGRG